FLVIARDEAKPTQTDKTSIVFEVRDRVGALHDILVPFKKANINLMKIESRPSKKKAWGYYFFVDFVGHHEEARIKKALSLLEKNCTFLKILGSYPKADS
ncbi:MAG TPA: ACT domain-containing protein, partial [Candidatus Omnitrophota bacterium]|nr:ACT domain-containing protein [Candidatus Omnitrophota bacterium]